MTILEEMEAEAWHILTTIYTYQRLMEGLTNSSTRYELANQLVALNALLEMLVIRLARLADKRKDVRSVSMFLKRGSYSASPEAVKLAAEKFLALAEPVLKIRHEQIAHMKPGTLSSFEPRELPNEALRATEALIDLIDIARDHPQSYTYRVGSQEPAINLRASVETSELVKI
ncbi:TPA: hypothetical protein RHY09_002374 [Escherichia coli]|jgi:hypothetical protein|uniref:hypothetical protein n=1 Tax=Enterobacteriaceae TaxID=543 RepID=UPI0001B52599|nr:MULTISPECIES: hypothetical protein [Enterobacteriaceae]HBN2388415.1 hypothetical protein [Escherichia coli O25b:H4-ST131]AQW02759.1 hypothetical protein BE939_17715 [Escherichia coli]EAA1587745.1 hypothetical protein [Escherichia coli]EAA5677129.1 hypothetical protein [Escherichia coli]EAB9602393.1 hypothetical protein [Escherichia coli]